MLDEADRILDMGFMRETGNILEKIRSNTSSRSADIQKVLFSASIPKELRTFTSSWISKPIFIDADVDKDAEKDVGVGLGSAPRLELVTGTNLDVGLAEREVLIGLAAVGQPGIDIDHVDIDLLNTGSSSSSAIDSVVVAPVASFTLPASISHEVLYVNSKRDKVDALIGINPVIAQY